MAFSSPLPSGGEGRVRGHDKTEDPMTGWILVIDDDPGTREALADILRRAGYQVTSLAGDTPVEEALSHGRYQVAVLDYRLPTLTGLDLAAHLKRLQPHCRVILISAELPDAEAAQESGVVDHFLAKPFSKDAILEVIAQLCHSGAH
jgi:DNA-binding NtrC family response regulator